MATNSAEYKDISIMAKPNADKSPTATALQSILFDDGFLSGPNAHALIDMLEADVTTIEDKSPPATTLQPSLFDDGVVSGPNAYALIDMLEADVTSRARWGAAKFAANQFRVAKSESTATQ